MSFICGSGSCGSNCHNGNHDTSFLRQLDRFVGETVTIFTTSGGASGCGFTGVILSVNRCFVRLVTDFGTPPANPLAENICGDMGNGMDPGRTRGCGGRSNHTRSVGAVVDIPIEAIAAFCHNAV